MTIAPEIDRHYPGLNNAQREVIGHIDGALLVIAGPGSGKTHSIVLRALNLLLLGKAEAKEIVLCTFTEKAALSMRERLGATARKIRYTGDLSDITISTIHGLCNRILLDNRHRAGNDYIALDELTQQLFIFHNFEEIIGDKNNPPFLGRWNTRWTAIEGAQKYFNKIAEEMVDAEKLTASGDDFCARIGSAYQQYRRALLNESRIDFAHMQLEAYRLLQDETIADDITQNIRYLLVDEYQDTNYIQQELMLKLSEKYRNLCVVGDEDQSIYRFRGATVRNILEFPSHFPGCKQIKLTTNYRSHRDIIARYDRWMASANWSIYRFNKKIVSNPDADHPHYPAVISIWGENPADEGARFAGFVKFLKEQNIIGDYSQVALLLHSVQEQHSGHYVKALEKQDIPSFCPRARGFFDIEEIHYLIACYALLFDWHGEGRGEVAGSVKELADYVDGGMVELARNCDDNSPLIKLLQKRVAEIAALKEEESLDTGPADFFYQLLAVEPFRSALQNENTARNLSIFSRLLKEFQSYYRYRVITHRNREFIRFHFFNSFLRLLYKNGLNEFEDRDQPFPKGHVQIMTIHQAKGLEFPVVAVGSLSAQLSSPRDVDKNLAPFYHRCPFEPSKHITHFDRMRLHYVAFSRAEKILMLTAHKPPKPHFSSIWEGLPQWPYVEKKLLAAQCWEDKDRIPVKRSYSFTTDLSLYETCPRQYQFFREYEFTPSRVGGIFFGLLVHETIESIHRKVLDGELHALNEKSIRELFNRVNAFLVKRDMRPITPALKEQAFAHVINYFRQNQEDIQRVQQTEVDVSLEKDGYILTGKVDLLLGGDGRLELLDFKTSQRPSNGSPLIQTYERQLCTYAHILQQRHGRHVDRLFIYWTSENLRKDALMELPYNPTKVEEAGRCFDDAVQRIQAKEFVVRQAPERKVCDDCDFRMLCTNEGIIRR